MSFLWHQRWPKCLSIHISSAWSNTSFGPYILRNSVESLKLQTQTKYSSLVCAPHANPACNMGCFSLCCLSRSPCPAIVPADIAFPTSLIGLFPCSFQLSCKYHLLASYPSPLKAKKISSQNNLC